MKLKLPEFSYDEIINLDEEQLNAFFSDKSKEDVIHFLKLNCDIIKSYQEFEKIAFELIEKLKKKK